MQNVIATSVIILLCNNYFAKGKDECPPIETDDSVIVAYDASKTRALFECRKSWYLMVGHNEYKTSYCSDGSWSPPAPKCEVQCKIPRNPKNGKAHYNGLKPGSTLNYNCSENFVLSEHQTRICTRFGLWSHKNPLCIDIYPSEPSVSVQDLPRLRVECPDIETDDSVIVAYDATKTRALFECRTSWYLMVGHNEYKISYCSLGRWSPPAPKCEVQCKIPRNPKNGKAHYNGLKPGSTLSYNCSENFVLSEHQTRICTRFGLWSHKDPICIGN